MSKHWFITGASSGLGRSLAEEVLSKGDRLTAAVRRPSALDDLASAYGDRLRVEALDVTLPEDVGRIIAKVLARGRVDVVVNNAGGSLIGATEEMTDAQVQGQLALNLLAPIQITRGFLQSMREQGGGRIIQISSASGHFATPVSSLYHASKWGLEGFSEGVALEVAEFGVFVTLVAPGGIRTGFKANTGWTTETAAYEGATVGAIRRFFVDAGDDVFSGNPAKMAQAIFDTTRSPRPPLRLVLGADSFETIRRALKERLAALESQEDLARAMGFDA